MTLSLDLHLNLHLYLDLHLLKNAGNIGPARISEDSFGSEKSAKKPRRVILNRVRRCQVDRRSFCLSVYLHPAAYGYQPCAVGGKELLRKLAPQVSA